jgi:hypothetical protein
LLFLSGYIYQNGYLDILYRSAGITVKAGNFWYDSVSGAYGNVGWPVGGFVQAGLPIDEIRRFKSGFFPYTE